MFSVVTDNTKFNPFKPNTIPMYFIKTCLISLTENIFTILTIMPKIKEA